MVRNLEAALPHWLALGIGPWNVWTFDAQRLPHRTYRGRQGSFEARVALCSIGPVTYELVESLTGPSIWDDFLRERGPGMHHFGYYVDDIDGAIEAMSAKAIPSCRPVPDSVSTVTVRSPTSTRPPTTAATTKQSSAHERSQTPTTRAALIQNAWLGGLRRPGRTPNDVVR